MKGYSTMKILIADDDKNFGFLLKNEVEEAGYLVDITKNGVEALINFIENKYKLVLLDIRMPSLNGIDTLRIIKKLCKDIPAFTFSGTAEDEERAESVEAGAIKCLVKPFEISDLMKDIEEHI